MCPFPLVRPMDIQFVLSNSVSAYIQARPIDGFQSQVVTKIKNGRDEHQYNNEPKSKRVWSNFKTASVAGEFVVYVRIFFFLCDSTIIFLESTIGAAVFAVLASGNSVNVHCAGGSRQSEYLLAHAIISFYAGVKSFHAIQSSDSRDDKQWLTFWLLYSLLELACTLSDFVLGHVIPFYNELKCAFLLFLGVFGGAKKVYPVVEPFLLQGEVVANKYRRIFDAQLDISLHGEYAYDDDAVKSAKQALLNALNK